MIERIVIKNYRIFEDLDLEPSAGMNILVGDNEAGKSTLLEAIAMALTGRVNGKWIRDELNPYWFHTNTVSEYFASLATGIPNARPEILIELYFTKAVDALQSMRGIHNSLQEKDYPGVRVRIAPSDDYKSEFDAYMDDPNRTDILPVEYYDVEWQDFADNRLTRRPKSLGLAVIDSRTIRSTSGVDFHTREMLQDFVEEREKAAVGVEHRKARHAITETTLNDANARIAQHGAGIHDKPLGLQMDQSSNASWESSIVPRVADVPFAMAGQGQQAAIKVALAMHRKADTTSFVLVEEPENHLSHTKLTRLIDRIETLAGDRQTFVTTHSSFVLNRLGLDKLRLLTSGNATQFSVLSADTVRYFKRLSGYDTLRLVLAEKVVLVEGPSDEMLFERAFHDKHGATPISRGIDVISMRGVALARSLELATALDRKVAALRDNDGQDAVHWAQPLAAFLQAGKRELFTGDKALGPTLEPQLLSVNDDAALRTLLNYDGKLTTLEWMSSNKTEAALRIAEAATPITYPDYFMKAIEFVE